MGKSREDPFAVMEQDGCTVVGILHDNEVFGEGLATNVEAAAEGKSYELINAGGIDTQAANYRAEAQDLASQGIA